MTNKKAFLLLWKWAVKHFSMRWFRYKTIDVFLKKGEIESETGQLFLVRKSFFYAENGFKTEYTLRIEFFKDDKEPLFLDEMKGTEEKS